MTRTGLFSLCLFVGLAVPAFSQEHTDAQGPTRIYLIGNSLTWDTVPSRLDQDVQWHVDCGKSLKFIYENPESPCVKSSTLWPQAFAQKKYDIISVQPHYGTTVAEDLAVISQWIELQPQALFIIHTGWARSATLLEEYSNMDPDGKLTHSPAYFSALLTALKEKHPTTEFRTTHAMRLLKELQDQTSKESVPLKSIEEIYRDAIHVTTGAGRYLMHNAMRETMGQPRSAVGFPDFPAELRPTLDQLLDQRSTWEFSGPVAKALKL